MNAPYIQQTPIPFWIPACPEFIFEIFKAFFYLAIALFPQLGMRSLLVLIGTYTVLIALITQNTFIYVFSLILPRHQTTLIFAAHGSLAKASSGLMKQQEVRSIIQQAAKAWRTGDADAFANLLASNGLFMWRRVVLVS